MIQPPNFAGLEWTSSGAGHMAPATEAFWPVYRWSRQRLFQLGMKVEKAGDDWRVIFTPRFSQADVQQQIDAMLVEIAEVEARQQQQREEAAARRAEADRIRAEERAAYAEAHKQVLAERLPPAIEAARKVLAEFGEFVVRKDRVRAAIDRFDDPDTVHPLGINDLILLEEAVRDTRTKSSLMFDKIRRLQDRAVDWPEADVVDAIERLTLQDGDRASVENSIGWNKPDSPSGHWCYAMLQRGDDAAREAAIKLGRVLVGKYATTQLGRECAA